MPKPWEPTLETTTVVLTGTFTVCGDGAGTLLILVDDEERLWELHPHVVKQYLHIRETFPMPVALDVKVVENMYVSPKDKTPWVTVSPRFRRKES
jgi:hypothetical protein